MTQIVFRTSPHGVLSTLERRTRVAFEIDDIDVPGRQGWSVLIQGPAHHVSADERESAERAGVEPWPAGDRELFIRIVPTRVTGRRIEPS